MKKLKLDLDTLAVESYATQATEAAEGTVAAHSDPVLATYVATKVSALTIAATEYLSVLC